MRHHFCIPKWARIRLEGKRKNGRNEIRKKGRKTEATDEGMRQVICAGCKSPIAFKATQSLNNGYAPVMRQVINI